MVPFLEGLGCTSIVSVLSMADNSSQWLDLLPHFSDEATGPERLGVRLSVTLRMYQDPSGRAMPLQMAGVFCGLGDGGAEREVVPSLSCSCCSRVQWALQSQALNKPPLNVNWKSQLCRRCQFLMSLIPSGPSIFSSNSLLIWSPPLWFCDGDNVSGRWEARTPFSFNVPRRRQGRHHLEGEGQIIKKYIHTNKLPGLDGPWVLGVGGEERSSGRRGDGGGVGLMFTD